MRHLHLAAMAAAMFISACGGGGGGYTSPTTPVVTPSTSVTVALSGTAAKGLMANADVNVYAANADGTISTTSLVSTTTKADGTYSLSFSGDQGKAYVIKVSAKADGSTTHADEVSGSAQALPAGFSMRALLIPASTGAITTSASITPFSELAVAAAAKASGGITADNAKQAISTIQQLLGFDPRSVAVVPTSMAGASPDEQKLAVLLASVSQLASTGALGCSTGSGGDKTQCVVNALAGAATTTERKLGSTGGGIDVSRALNDALTTVLKTPSLSGAVNSAILTTVVSNLVCKTSCTAATAGTTPSVDATAVAITAAKLLFDEIKSDWAAMFSQGGASSIATGAANAEAFKFKKAVTDLQQPALVFVNQALVIGMGIELFDEFVAGRSTDISRNSGSGEFDSNDTVTVPDRRSPVSCLIYQDSATTRVSTLPTNANFLRCIIFARIDVEFRSGKAIYTQYGQLFVLTPKDSGNFDWVSRAVKRTIDFTTSPSTKTVQDLQVDSVGADRVFVGKVTTTADSSGQLTSLNAAGDFPGGFDKATSKVLVSDRSTVSLTMTRSLDAASHISTDGNMVGSINSLDAAGASLGTLTFKKATIGSMPVSKDSKGNIVAPASPKAVAAAGFALASVSLDVIFATPSASIEGNLSLSDSTWDKSLTQSIPAKGSFVGTLSETHSGVMTTFLKGSLTVVSTGYDKFDATLPLSSTNQFTGAVTFIGDIAAPGRPTMEVTLGAVAATSNHDGHIQSSSLQYRTLVNGNPRTVVNVSGTPDATGKAIGQIKLTEASANLALTWKPGDTTIKIFNGGTLEIGSVNTANGLVTFKDGSTMSLDIGL